MTILAIIGLGSMGKALAKRFAGKTDLILAGRDGATATAFAATLPPGVTVLDQDAAIAKADVVILAMPFAAALEAGANRALKGKILLDIVNPLNSDLSGLSVGHTSSAAEQLQATAPEALVVKGYNTIFASLLDLPAEQTARVPVYLAGDDEGAVEAVAALVTLSGFAVERTGGLDGARLLEPLAMLGIRLAFRFGRGTDIAPVWTTVAS
ncbi:NADPH-dependent F420 reductase [uncultured Devosia sp.]|uniref:NADPH-dependent F420 reductase n=1 Tax=uncultured Devosia sp. TaxID=211434 RepID=UPI0035CC7191